MGIEELNQGPVQEPVQEPIQESAQEPAPEEGVKEETLNEQKEETRPEEQNLKLWQERVDIAKKRIAIAKDAEQKQAAINDLRAARHEVRELEAALHRSVVPPAEPQPKKEKRLKGLESLASLMDKKEIEKERALWEERVRIGYKRLAIAESDEQKLAAVQDIRAAKRELQVRERLLSKFHQPQKEQPAFTSSIRQSGAVPRRIERVLNLKPNLPNPERIRREAARRARQLKRAGEQPRKGSTAEVSQRGKGTSYKVKQKRHRRELLNR
ncbi:MAG TPA: hypothetical protein VNK70_01270 [Candidatus Paceibacterota bacterium]|nr:hypothetical protein [Candidatus Paceibacterota bacterium]